MAHGDYTGNLKARLAAEYREKQEREARRVSMTAEVQKAVSDEVIDLMPRHGVDYSDALTEIDPDDPQYDEKIATLEHYADENGPVEFRCRESVEGVTVGRDNTFNLEAGRKYRVPKWVYQHLDDKELVYH